MHNTPDLRILFPTSFSEACFRTASAIAQLADTCRVSLTIAHVTNPGQATIKKRRELDSFLAEADHYESCYRTLMEAEDPVKAISELCETERFDLILAPASDRLGLHSFFTRSFRARLLKHCKAPVWTVGSCLDRINFSGSIQTVACLVDLSGDSDTYLPLAVALGSFFGARLRILNVIPPIDEGTLAHSISSNAPLMPEVALERIRSAFAGRNCPEIDVAVGDGARELPRLLARCHADLLFVGPGQALNGIWQPSLSPYLDRLPCPVICVDGASATFDQWTFQDVAASTRQALVYPGDYVIAS